MSEEIQLTKITPEDPDNFNSILYGAILIVVIGIIPYLTFLNVCCLGLLGGGLLSVWHYTKTYSLTITSGEGFKLGALTGIMGGLSLYALQLLILTLFDYQPGTEEIGMLMKNLLKDNPAALDEYEKEMLKAKAEAFSVKNLSIGLLTTLLIYPLFVGLGGTIGALLFKKGEELNQ